MAVPTVTTVSPEKGHTGGRMIVEIVGSGFRLPSVAEESVRVFFDAEPSPKVDVATDGRIFALTPKRDVGLVALRVLNVDASGTPIPGEEVTVADAFEFAKPQVTTEHEGELAQLTRGLLRDLKLQLLDNVTISTHTDFGEEGGVTAHVVEIAELPGIILVGPDLEENRFYSLNEEPDCTLTEDVEGNPVEFATVNVPKTVDVSFSIFGFSNRKVELLNLQALVVWYFKENKFFSLEKGAIRSDDGASYEMDLVTDPRSVGAVNNDNLHGFTSRMTIRGFDLNLATGLGIDGLKSQTRRRSIYSDDQGAEITVESSSTDPKLVVRSILGGGCGRGMSRGAPSNLAVRSVASGNAANGAGLQFTQADNPVVRSIPSKGRRQ